MGINDLFKNLVKYLMIQISQLFLPSTKFKDIKEWNSISILCLISVKNARDQGLATGNVLLCDFGVGYSWGATILKI